MKRIHLADSATILKHGMNFQRGHYFDLPNGKVITIYEMSDHAEANFVADGAVALPHMLDTTPIGPEIAASLGHLGIKPEHKTFDVLMAVGKIHPAFKPSSY
jgi:hypothetical protein